MAATYHVRYKYFGFLARPSKDWEDYAVRPDSPLWPFTALLFSAPGLSKLVIYSTHLTPSWHIIAKPIDVNSDASPTRDEVETYARCLRKVIDRSWLKNIPHGVEMMVGREHRTPIVHVNSGERGARIEMDPCKWPHVRSRTAAALPKL